MAFFDFPLAELTNYKPETDCPADLQTFWAKTLQENHFDASKLTVRPVDTNLSGFEVYDVTFPGYGGQAVAGWFVCPSGTTGAPAIVEFVGYGGGRGFPEERLFWPSAGFSYLLMDTRGQGSIWGSGGSTPDGDAGSSNTRVMTRGIESPDSYYYRRFFVDAHHAVEAAAQFTQVDPTRVSVCGGSQGGGGALAAASLNQRVFAAMPEVPFLAHFKRAVGLTNDFPYQEIVEYLSVKRDQVDSVFATLSYFDVANLGRLATAPALFSVGLMDTVAPPSTVFAAKNWYGGDAEISVYPYNGHEAGGTYHLRAQHKWLLSKLRES